MWTTLKLFIFFIAATVLHWAFSTLFASIGLHVSIMLVFAVAVCPFVKPQYGYTVAFFCGLFLDFFGTKLFGNNAMTFSILAAIVYALSERFDFESIFPQMMTVFSLSIFAILCNTFLLELFTSVSAWQGWWSLFGGSLVNALLAPVVFFITGRMFSKGFKPQL